MKIIKRITEKVDRNIDVVKEYNKGTPIREMREKFNVSRTRIYQILKRFEEER